MAISIPVIIVLEYEGLPMDVKVRDLFRQETSDRVKFKNFDDIYYMFPLIETVSLFTLDLWLLYTA